MKLRLALLTFATILGTANTSHADLISNLGQGQDNTTFFNTTSRRYATDFLTGGTATTITSLTARMANDASIAHNFTFSIFTNSGSNAPGTLVGTFDTIITIPASSPTYAQYGATDVGINLAANTTYWLVAGMNEAGFTGHWAIDMGQGVDSGSVFATVPATQVLFSDDSGASYLATGVAGNLMFALNNPPAAVPEPSTLLLTGSALSAFGIGWLRRRRATFTGR